MSATITRLLKIRNRNFSQWIGREELFERECESDPDADAGAWSRCVLACETASADFFWQFGAVPGDHRLCEPDAQGGTFTRSRGCDWRINGAHLREALLSPVHVA
jgi:hypothetical protein